MKFIFSNSNCNHNEAAHKGYETSGEEVEEQIELLIESSDQLNKNIILQKDFKWRRKSFTLPRTHTKR